MFKQQRSAVAMAHEFVSVNLPEDGTAVDATAGNGNDTVFLSRHLPKGKVFSFDVQEQALNNTAKLLEQQGQSSNGIELIHDGHQNMDRYISDPVDVVMFNLGYLPGSDHSIITKPDNTKTALQKAIQFLNIGGKISIVVYTGHQGGMEELFAVEEVLKVLDSRRYWIVELRHVNRPTTAPVSFYIERNG
ncbi:MAG: 16S rRNA (cytosine(1402)-N(4))-methyltransferase [Firmicutes bacterium]|nr:16S rRNA (cytosine(1402)-N(4))-methyltransferase [Bacillota bacterium]